MAKIRVKNTCSSKGMISIGGLIVEYGKEVAVNEDNISSVQFSCGNLKLVKDDAPVVEDDAPVVEDDAPVVEEASKKKTSKKKTSKKKASSKKAE